MCNQTYASVDIARLTDACSCFLYDMHDPESCSSGLIFMYSNFGAGQDPWLFICCLALLLYWRGVLKSVSGAPDPHKVCLGDVIFSDKVFGWVCIGGGLLGCTICQAAQRALFVTLEPSSSRLFNVALSGWFNASFLFVLLGLTSCWWKEVFLMHQASGYSEEAPYSGFFRKTFLLINPSVGDTFRKVVKYFAHAVEIFFFGSLLSYIICGMLFAASKENRAEGSGVQQAFLLSARFYNSGYLLFLLDSAVALTLYFYFGLRRRVKLDVGIAQVVTGLQYSKYRKSELSLLMKVLSISIFGAFVHERLILGFCPYIPAEKDLAHGGDPAELVSGDLTNFTSLFLLCLFLLRRLFKDTYLYWRNIDFDTSADDQVYRTALGHPKWRRNIAVASIISSAVLVTVGICLFIAQVQLPASAVAARALYFLSFFAVQSTVHDQRLSLMLLDGRFAFQRVFQVLSLAMLGALLVLYILSAVYFVTLNEHAGGNIIRFDVVVVITALCFAVIKTILVEIYEKLADSRILVSSSSDDSEDREGKRGGDHENTLSVSAGAPATAPNRRIGTALRVLTFFADVFGGTITVILLLFVVWNALALVLVLYVFARIARMGLQEIWMKADVARGKNERRLGMMRRAISLVVQVFFGAVMFFVLQSFYFLGGPLPYNERQILIAGHRGVWTDGYAENSIEAFEYAQESGFHSVEFDLQLTKDRQLVVLHDTTLERTTTGTGFVSDYTLAELQRLALKREGSGEVVPSEYPYNIDEIIQEALARNFIMNFDTKPGPGSDLISVPLVLDAICRNNATEVSFIASGEPRFHHLLYHLEPRISLQRDFLLYTTTITLLASPNVNVIGVSAELLLFNPWIIPNMHAAGKHVFVYFLAIETPFFLNWFVDWGVDMVMVNDPADCLASGLCEPPRNYTLDRTIPI